jgi:hypothetical protein
VCSGGLIFLGLRDISFDVLNGIYCFLSVDILLAINVWCIGFGSLSAIVFAAKFRATNPE